MNIPIYQEDINITVNNKPTVIEITDSIPEPPLPEIFSNLSFISYVNNPILSPTSGWESHVVGDPFIIDKDNLFYLFYWAWGNAGRTGFATSTDLNTWTKYTSNPILNVGGTGTWDEHDAAKPVIILKDNIYYMFYAGKNTATLENTRVQIGLATSTDLINWTKEISNPLIEIGDEDEWDGGSIEPGAIYELDGVYYLYYFGIPKDGVGKQHVGLATSTDLLNWTKYDNNPVLKTGGLEDDWDYGWIAIGTRIIKIGDYYLTSYNGGNTIHSEILQEPGIKQAGLAYSTDLINWHKFSNNPIVTLGSSGSWDSGAIWRTHLYLKNNILYLFYNASTEGSIKEHIGMKQAVIGE